MARTTRTTCGPQRPSEVVLGSAGERLGDCTTIWVSRAREPRLVLHL